MLKENLTLYINESIWKNWDINAISDYKGASYSYSDIATHIYRLHKLYRDLDVRRGDKIALIGKNSARWCIVYLSAITYGAVIVPILPDFKKEDYHKIIDHSDSVLLFVDRNIFGMINPEEISKIAAIFDISDFSTLHSGDEKTDAIIRKAALVDPIQNNELTKESYSPPQIGNDQLAVISYTSGTTGFSKGVMLLHNSLTANIRFARENMPLNPGDRIVSFLPLAHTFGCAFEFLFPFTLGCHITILTKTPSPQIVIQAFQEVKPNLILTVPLVIEKIYKKRVLPSINQSHIKALLAIPGIRQIILNKIRKKLTAVFGGEFKELVIGAAPLNIDAEKLFKDMKFRFTVGYGMTECGPLISYVKWDEMAPRSCGRPVDTLELKIDSPDPERIPGEIMVRGENVMVGYYKNKEATKSALEADGWLHTGDLGLIDKHNNLFIKGRLKSMILGPSGKNIYPEEIESHFDNLYAVSESLVVQRNEKLTVLIFPDDDTVRQDSLDRESLTKIYDGHRQTVNERTPGYMNVTSVEIHEEEFVKTPKKSIKRYLYS